MPERVDYDADGGIGYRAPGVLDHGARFGFGHGLGYAPTRCRLVAVDVADGRLRLDLEVSNDGDRDTVHVAQAYAAVGDAAAALVGLLRLPVPAGGTVRGALELGPEAFARYAGSAQPVAGEHLLRVATSSADPGIAAQVRVVAGRVAAAARV